MDDGHSPLLGKPVWDTFLLHVFTWGWVMYVEIREQFVRILLIQHVIP